jgi:dihydrolipoamide dehydrogenase
MPTKWLVIGSGAIGIEFASFYNDMGADVTVVEMLPRILPVEDEEVSAFMEKRLAKEGIRILTGAGLEKLEPSGEGISASIKGQDGQVAVEPFSHVIVAIGIVPNTEEIGLESLGVETERGHIKVDGYGRTNVDGVYAIGDVTGAPWLAHKASHEGIVCVEAIAGLNPHPFETWNIPGCTYSRPQVASVGLTEARAKEVGHAVRVGKFPFIGNGKAIALGEADGFVKTVFDAKTGELLGAHMVGAEVTELIQGYVIARQLETTEAELMETVFAHPTLSEMMHESVLGAYDRALHI